MQQRSTFHQIDGSPMHAYRENGIERRSDGVPARVPLVALNVRNPSVALPRFRKARRYGLTVAP